MAADPPVSSAAAAIDARVQAELNESAVPGAAVVVVQDGSVVYSGAFGSAGGGRPMAVSTPVLIGSVGKSITALAVRQLAEAGRLDLDQPARRYIPWLALDAPPAAVDAISVRSLLTHTSGLSTADGQDPRWYEPGLSPESVARSLREVKPDRPSGSYEYSNLNYVLLGAIVEAVSGQPYGAYLEEHVFKPLGMAHSASSLDSPAVAGRATGHRYLLGVPVAFEEPYASGMVPAGYHVSTAEDLAVFAGALAAGGRWQGRDVVTERSVAATPAPTLGTDWLPFAAGPGASSSQSGSTLATNADILVVPSERLAVAVVLNANPTQLLGLPRGAADLALDAARLHLAQQPTSGPPTVRTVYLAVGGLLAFLTALLAVHAVRARTWRTRWASGRGHRRLAIRTIALDAVIPVAVLLAVPLLIGATGSSAPRDFVAGWRFLFWTLPDIGVALLALPVAALVIGAAKALTALRVGSVP